MNLDDPKEIKDIDAQAIGQICYDVYRQFAERRKIMTHEAGSYAYCNEVCELLIPQLTKKYPENVIRIMARKLGPTTGHTFITIEAGGDTWILDPTWQQFINYSGSKRRQIPEKPMVMWVKKSELVQELTRLEIPANIQHIWLEAKSVRPYRGGRIIVDPQNN